jgi:hypothetical protein
VLCSPPHRATSAATTSTARPRALLHTSANAAHILRLSPPPSTRSRPAYHHARAPLDAITSASRILPGQPLLDKPVSTGVSSPTSSTRSPTPCHLDCPTAPRALASPGGNGSAQRIARARLPNGCLDNFTQHPYIGAMTYCPLPPLPTRLHGSTLPYIILVVEVLFLFD